MCDLITFKNPAVIRLPSGGEDVENFLKYRDKGAEYLLYRLKTQARYGGDWVEKRAQELKAEINKTALWQDEEGNCYTYAGLAGMLQ